jgi:MFS family permease
MQTVLGYSPIEAGAAILASTIAIMLAAPGSGKLSDHIGARVPIAVGMVMFGVALLLLSQVDVDTGFWDMFPWLVLGGLGFGLVMPPATAAILGSVPVDKAGVASGVMQSFRQLGGGLGVAIAGAIMAAELDERTPATLGYAGAFVDGLEKVLVFAGLAAIAGGLVAAATIRRYRELEALEGSELGATGA